MPIHLGVNLREKKCGLKLTRENYAVINRKSSLRTGKSAEIRQLPTEKMTLKQLIQFVEESKSFWVDRKEKLFYADETERGMTLKQLENFVTTEGLDPDAKIYFATDYKVFVKEEGVVCYREDWCEKHLKNCLKNFDLNMEYFSALNHDEFSDSVTKFLQKNKEWSEVTDLNNCSGKSGYYMMVLDDYCQVYIGTTGDIKKRIQNHWSRTKDFDRLLFPMNAVNSSLLSIDSFRAYDTTRVYTYITPDIYNQEDNYINDIPAEFLCNRMAGGLITGGLIQAITMMKQRQLTK